MLDGDTVICETVSGRQHRKTPREFCLCLSAERFYLLRGGDMNISLLFLLLGHGLEDPVTTGLEENAGGGIRQHGRNGHRNSLDRVHTYADVPAAHAFPEHHLPYLGVYNYLFTCSCHIMYFVPTRDGPKILRAFWPANIII